MVFFAMRKATFLPPSLPLTRPLQGPSCVNVRSFVTRLLGYEAPAASSSRMRAFKITNIFLMAATSATFPGLPFARSLR